MYFLELNSESLFVKRDNYVALIPIDLKSANQWESSKRKALLDD
ncbi:hypothetical protein [Cytobacillus firmus]|nr:hypothetical protein [Cytobacillus firmus]